MLAIACALVASFLAGVLWLDATKKHESDEDRVRPRVTGGLVRKGGRNTRFQVQDRPPPPPPPMRPRGEARKEPAPSDEQSR